MTRLLFLVHRYLGIALGLLMVVWCISGIVMMYVPFPSLEERQRFAGLSAIDAAPCCVLEGENFPGDDATIRSFEIEMLGERPLLSLTNDGGRISMLELDSGAPFQEFTLGEAGDVARRFAAALGIATEPEFVGEIESDQWTTGRFGGDRPLYHFALGDPAGSELYVSSTTGKAVQATTASVRFWNWFGSVPHWLYFTRLRENPATWSRIVIWTSLIGCVLTIIGIYIGIRQVRRRRSDGRLASPYRGLWYWHHVPGIVFGLFTLTWVFSGLLSMNPWGFLGNSDPTPALQRLYGEMPEWQTLRAALPTMIANAPDETVHLRFAPFDGDIYAVALDGAGNETRLDSNGGVRALNDADFQRVAALIGEGREDVSWALISEEDSYYYGRANAPPPFPALRVSTAGEGAAHYYLNPASGRLVRFADAEGRWFRWLFNGLHSLDFTKAFRWRPFWDVMMIGLLLGATLVCATGTWLGIKRLSGRSRGQGFLVDLKRRTPG